MDSPVHLADFGAALTSADSVHLQDVLECQDVGGVYGHGFEISIVLLTDS